MWKNSSFITKLISNVPIRIIPNSVWMLMNYCVGSPYWMVHSQRMEDDGLIMFFMLEAERLFLQSSFLIGGLFWWDNYDNHHYILPN